MSKTNLTAPVIVIKDINNNKITLNINGEIRQIQGQLSELKSLLQSFNTQKIQYAEKIYNIEQINEANFGLVTGKRAFNEYLTKTLIISIAPYSSSAKKLLEKIAYHNIPDWEKQANTSNKAKEIIAYSFVGIIGIQLSKLIAIGKENFSETKQQKYIEKCIHIAQRSMDLVNFSLLSRFWDEQKKANFIISADTLKVLSKRFKHAFGPSLEEQFQLLQTLHAVFLKYELLFPMVELSGFEQHLQKNSTFFKNCQALQALQQKLVQDAYSLLDCIEAEQNLADFLTHFPFLVNYKMASIKRINYLQIRNASENYLHRFISLGIDSKANVDAEKVKYTAEKIHTDAVLLYKGDNYQNSINLFPFVIDYNVLTFEYGAKICFFRSNHLLEDSLEYLFLEDNSIVDIEMRGILKTDTEYNELMMSDEKRKTLNLDNVVTSFREAQNCILNT